MIQINLLPVRQIKQRNRARQEVIVLLVAFLLLLGAIGFVAFRQADRISGLQLEQAQLEKEKDGFQSVVAMIAKIKKDQQVLENKMKVIKDLKSASQLSPRVLDEIANLTQTDRMWLTSLDYSDNIITLSGTALDNATIAEYMNRIGASDFFMTSELKNSSLTMIGNQKLKSFSMTITVLASLIPKPAPPPAAKK